MSLVYTYDGTAITHNIEPSAINIGHRADMGEEFSGGIPFEDPTASLTLVGHKTFTVEEDDCAQPRLFTGWTTVRGIGRDLDRGMFVGAEPRLQDTTIVDMQAAFGFRQITGADGNRPAETWQARCTWILQSDYLDDAISHSEDFIVTNTTAMDAADYRGSTPSAVMDDLSDRSGNAYTYCLFWDPAESEITLFFDNDAESIADCTLSISNVYTDVDNATCFAPDSVAVLQREPDQVYSEVVIEYNDGTQKLFRSRPSTAAMYIRRGTTIQRPYTKSLATATSQAEKWLDRHAAETDRITCTILVPSSAAGLVQAGQRMSVKFSHMPGYTDWTWMRVVSCSPKPSNDVADFYEIALELTARPAWTFEPSCADSVLAGLYPTEGATNVPAGMFTNEARYIHSPEYATDGTHTSTVIVPQIGASYYYSGAIVNWNNWMIQDFLFTLPSAQTIQTIVVKGDIDLSGNLSSWSSELSMIVDGVDYDAATYATADDNGYGWLELPVNHCLTWDLGAPVSATTIAFRRRWYVGTAYLELFHLWEICAPGTPADTVIELPPAPGATTEHTVDPTADDDTTLGYTVGAIWINTTTGDPFIAVDVTDGAAVWEQINGAGVTDHGALTGLADDDHTQYVLKRYGGKEVVSTVAATGATETIDLANGNVFDETLTADCTLTFAGATAGVACSFTLLLRQDGTGGWTTTWPGSVVWAGGSAPTLDETASTVAVLTFFTLDGGTVWYGFPTGGGGGTPATTVTDETTWGITPAVGSDTEYARQDHTHGSPAAPTGTGELLITDTPAGSPLIFDDILQNDAGDALLYADA